MARGAQEIADLGRGGRPCARGDPALRGVRFPPISRGALAPAVTQGVLLDAAAYLIQGVASELDDVKGTSGAGGVLELVVNGVFISLEGI